MRAYNDCLNAAASALRFLAEHPRPIGGEQHYNSLHLHQIADDLTYQAGKPDSERVSELLRFNNEFEQRARDAERAMKDLTKPRPSVEYDEDMGNVLWWKLDHKGNPTEAPYVGSPNDLGREVLILTQIYMMENGGTEQIVPYQGQPTQRVMVGGWPGYHTHWTPLPKVAQP